MRDEELDVPERMSTKKKKGERRVKSEILTERKEVEKGFGWIDLLEGLGLGQTVQSNLV